MSLFTYLHNILIILNNYKRKIFFIFLQNPFAFYRKWTVPSTQGSQIAEIRNEYLSEAMNSLRLRNEAFERQAALDRQAAVRAQEASALQIAALTRLVQQQLFGQSSQTQTTMPPSACPSVDPPASTRGGRVTRGPKGKQPLRGRGRAKNNVHRQDPDYYPNSEQIQQLMQGEGQDESETEDEHQSNETFHSARNSETNSIVADLSVNVTAATDIVYVKSFELEINSKSVDQVQFNSARCVKCYKLHSNIITFL